MTASCIILDTCSYQSVLEKTELIIHEVIFLKPNFDFYFFYQLKSNIKVVFQQFGIHYKVPIKLRGLTRNRFKRNDAADFLHQISSKNICYSNYYNVTLSKCHAISTQSRVSVKVCILSVLSELKSEDYLFNKCVKCSIKIIACKIKCLYTDESKHYEHSSSKKTMLIIF